jgi:hypothetical protein
MSGTINWGIFKRHFWGELLRHQHGMIQDGKLRGFAMGHAISVRTDYTAVEVRRFAQRAKDAAQARRLLAIAAIPTYRGTFPPARPRICCVALLRINSPDGREADTRLRIRAIEAS